MVRDAIAAAFANHGACAIVVVHAPLPGFVPGPNRSEMMMIASPKEWGAMLGFDRDADERTLAARARVLVGILGYLDRHFSDPDGERPSEHAIMEFGQYLALGLQKVGSGRADQLKDLFESIQRIHVQWDDLDRAAEFEAIAEKRAVFRGFIAFADAWLGTSLLPPIGRPVLPSNGQPVEDWPDEWDAKTRLVRRDPAEPHV